jgi:hypothetical protein
VGTKVTAMVQLEFAAKVPLQPFAAPGVAE